MSAVRDEFVAELDRLTGRPSAEIRDDTEIYYDLHLSGEDVDELCGWIITHGGAVPAGPQLTPGEVDFLGAVPRWLGIRRYPSFTFRHCLDWLHA